MVLLGWPGSARPAEVAPALEVFGTTRISAEQLARLPLAPGLAERLKQQYGFAFVKVSTIRYFEPRPGTFVTVDVVENAADLPVFVPLPADAREAPRDPLGALDTWDRYQTEAFRLLAAGTLATHQHSDGCPWHCLLGFEGPQLAGYRERLDRAAREHAHELEQILRSDPRPSWRARAAFVLAHGPDPERLVESLAPRLLDPDPTVRNNVARVFADLAHRSTVELPLDGVLALLHCPETTDRNKAAAILSGLLRATACARLAGVGSTRRDY